MKLSEKRSFACGGTVAPVRALTLVPRTCARRPELWTAPAAHSAGLCGPRIRAAVASFCPSTGNLGSTRRSSAARLSIATRRLWQRAERRVGRADWPICGRRTLSALGVSAGPVCAAGRQCLPAAAALATYVVLVATMLLIWRLLSVETDNDVIAFGATFGFGVSIVSTFSR